MAIDYFSFIINCKIVTFNFISFIINSIIDYRIIVIDFDLIIDYYSYFIKFNFVKFSITIKLTIIIDFNYFDLGINLFKYFFLNCII